MTTLAMRVDYVVTNDDPITGDAVVPGFGDEFFAAVHRRANHMTLWRTISLRTNAHETPPASRGILGGMAKDKIMTKHQKTQNLQTEKPQMKLKTESPALTAVQPATPETLAQLDADVAALAAEARELTENIRVGDDLRFKKGKWAKSVGNEETKVGATTPFGVDMRSYRHGWIKWLDRKPVFKAIGRPIDGFVAPTRDRLPDRDEDSWPRDARGVPQDPWQENFSIVMRDLSDGRLCTWTTTSYYGSKALGALLRTYVRDQKKHPDQMPVVLLASETKTTTNYGDVEAPVLIVDDWQLFGDAAAPPGMRNLPQPKLPVPQELLPPSQSFDAEDIPL